MFTGLPWELDGAVSTAFISSPTFRVGSWDSTNSKKGLGVPEHCGGTLLLSCPWDGGISECCCSWGCRGRAVLPVPCVLIFAGARAALQTFLQYILHPAFNKQINFSSCVQALPGTAAGFSIGLHCFSTPEKRMESISFQIKLCCCPRHAESGREEGHFYNLPPDVGDVEFSFEAT